ncbi:MAG: DUF92 domain-containing protein, partial [Bacteroidia bacterium]|nr:DUF92 domain-containing protein [Bacteroidia bacterium]
MRDIFSESGRVKCSSPRQGQTVSGKTGIGYFSNLEKELTSLLLLPASLLFYFFTVRKNLLSKAGAVSAAGMAILLVLFCGWMFLLPLLFFFLSSVAAGNILKKDPVLSDEKQGKARDAMQVWANGGVYLFFCLADAVYPGLFLS